MSFRSGINQVNGSNPAPIQLYTQTNIVNGGLRNEIPITLGVGTYKCSMSNQLNVTGTGSIQLLIFYTGLSGINGATVAVTPQPIISDTVRLCVIFTMGEPLFKTKLKVFPK